MGNWTVTGELGAGKTILSTGKIRQFLLDGKKVASNIDLFLEWMLPWHSKVTYTRVTDFPDEPELKALGIGGDSPKESTFGLLALDELAMFLNARSWQKDGRDAFIIFQRHLRKRRWHTLFLAQDVDSIDKQARNALVERVVRAGRTDRVRLPLVGGILQFLGFSGMRPQKHIGYVYYGKSVGPHAKWTEKWEYSGNELYNAYNTEQEFQPLITVKEMINGQEFDVVKGYWREWRTYGGAPQNTFDVEIVGSYTVLSAWHLYGRYLNFFQRHTYAIRVTMIVSTVIFGLALLLGSPSSTKDVVIPKKCLKPDSYILNGDTVAILYDNQVFTANFKNGAAELNGTCYTLDVNHE
jgi:hypothetical protein